ncbi:hypothetical protein [Pseudobutyrivibrio sp. LB2011]|uniref:hypothetical protein n=1 Tax=Pseudobutyrivibrio sp. LB2011 TaxID=1408312 RepID=UPI0005D1DF22|nr:hypothetical protein [Pseudobutyrivibrio sp. LB2011]
MPNMNDYISFNSDFRDSVNLYLDLNKQEKINSYLPTKSSVDILTQYLSAVENNRQHATLLVGPYGKGKSHLLLLMLAILSMDKNDKDNVALLQGLSKRVAKTDIETAKKIDTIIKTKTRFLPVLIMSTQGDLNQAFMVGLNDALRREGLTELTPETYYTHAIATIDRWKSDYPDTYEKYISALKERKISERNMHMQLMNCDADALEVFKDIYPDLTSGGIFNPLVNAEVLPMYKNIADKLVETKGYSGLYVVFDEFSKFIEGQDKAHSGNNMKLIQDVCELANSSKSTKTFFTMIAHKSIKEYGKYLSSDIINSFTGIEGRIKEVFFVTSTKNNYELIESAIFKKDEIRKERQYQKYVNAERAKDFFGLLPFSSTFTKEDFNKTVMDGCYPLTPTSAYLLLNISEKVAQNERTLFTFISKEEQHSMAKYVLSSKPGKEWIINADLIYDYFKNMFKKDISNEFIHNEWLNAEYALAQVSDRHKRQLIKTLAVINIVNKPDELPADIDSLRLASGVPDIEGTVSALEANGLIYKKGSTNCYVFKTRATSELKTEIKKRKDLRASKPNSNRVFSDISETQYILPKRYNYSYAMTRYFRYEYMDVETFLSINDLSVITSDGAFCDGKIVALYAENDEDYAGQIERKVKNASVQNLIVLLGNKSFELSDQVQEYEVLQDIKGDPEFFRRDGFEVLEKEIPVIQEDLEKEILIFLNNCFGPQSGRKVYYFEKGKLHVESEKSLSSVADAVAFSVYPDSIRINHELINREALSTPQIKKARKTIIEDLINGEDTDKYMTGTSAEATIYRAVFAGTGIRDGKYADKVEPVVYIFRNFISEAGDNKKSVSELIKRLTTAPIAMRGAVIPLYLAYFLAERNEDIVIYFGDKEVPLNSDIILNMCETPDDYSIFISLEDIKKEAYISDLTKLFVVQEKSRKSDSRIENLVVGMQRWFRALPQATKNIKDQNIYVNDELILKSIPKVKNLLQNVEANPYEILFIDLPKIFGTTNYKKIVKYVSAMKMYLNGYLEWITGEAARQSILVFDDKAKQNLNHTLQEWYQRQSDFAKQGLHSNKITAFMRCIEENQAFDDSEIVKKVIHAVTEMYIDTWNDASLEKYIDELKLIKDEIETLDDSAKNDGNCELKFISKNGEEIKCYYEPVSEGTGAIMKNILSDTLEDFNDLTVNEKVAILLEMIEKQLR